jgi:Protein of unknown function (DUF2846)
MKRYILVAAISLLVSCVSAPKATPEAQANARLFQTVPGKAQLYIVRPSSFGMAVLYQVSIDGRMVGSLPAETFMVETLTAGSHTVTLFNSTSQENTTIDVESDKNYYLRFGMTPTATSNRARCKVVSGDEGRQLVGNNTMVESMPLP